MAASESIKNRDLLALKAFVTAKDETQYNTLPSDLVLLDLTHSNLKQQHIEVRFFLSDTLETLRSRIHQKTGTPPAFQNLQIHSAGVMLVEIPPDNPTNYKLGYFGLQHGMRIHCIDLDPHSGSRRGQYEDTSLVKKYVMSDEEYNKRKGTLRDWERQQKQNDADFSLRKHAKQHRELQEAQRQAKLGLPLPKGFDYNSKGQVIRVEEDENAAAASSSEANKACCSKDIPSEESVQGIEVGMRCEVQPGGRRGRVAYVGVIPELGGGGHWVGVIFDEPVGKTDGTAAKSGKRYFEAPGDNYGGFIRGKHVTVGDFPERDLFDELDDDSEDEL